MPAAVELYDISVAVHVMAAILAFGPLFAFPLFIAITQQRDPASLPVVLRAVNQTERAIVVPATAVVGFTGVYQAIDGPYEFGRDQWLDVGFFLYLVVFGLIVFLVEPRRAQAAIEAERLLEAADEQSELELSRRYRERMRVPNALMPAIGLIVLFVTYLMEIKPASG